MDLKEEIEEYINNKKLGVTIEQIIKECKIERKESKNLAEVLFQLQKEGKIILDNNNYYLKVPEKFYLKSGTINISNRGNYYINVGPGQRVIIKKPKDKNIKKGDFVYVEVLKSQYRKNEGIVVNKAEYKIKEINYKYLAKAVIEVENNSRRLFVMIDEKKIYLSKENSVGFYPNDEVTVLVDYESNIAEVKEIIKRSSKEHIFKCIKDNNEKKWLPFGTYPFKIDSEVSDIYEVGDKIIGKIISEKDGNTNIEIIDKIKTEKECMAKIEEIIYEHGFNIGFSNKVKKEINKLNRRITENDFIERFDFRDLETFTIDPEKAKDLDDAISLKKDGDNYILYVHIADVSHYVRPKMETFREAINKGTSIYLPNYTEPMLPLELSNELCSLNQNEDKLTKTCIIKLDAKGNVLDYKIIKSIIRSNLKMSYDKVNHIIEGINVDNAYQPFCNTLKEMNKLAKILQNKRILNGSLVFETNEMVFKTDELGKIISLDSKNRGPAEIMIENFMLLTNQVIAEYTYWLNHPFIYRNHLAPTINDKLMLQAMLRKSDISNRINDIQDNKNMQKIINKAIKNKSIEERKYISSIFVKALNRAYFDNENMGHFALALDYYSMFTSPIRRGGDLVNHLMIDNILKYNLNDSELVDIMKNLKNICSHLTKREYEEEKVERNFQNIMLQEYVLKFINTPLNANITFITSQEIYIKTENNIPGFIIKNKNMKYLKDKKCFYNIKLNEYYKIGSNIDVLLKQKNIGNDSISFELIGLTNKDEKVLTKKEKK